MAQGTPEWMGGVAIARAPDSTTEVSSANYKYIVCEKASIKANPLYSRRSPNIVPDVDRVFPAGFNYTFSISGIEPDPNIMGYLLWLSLGSDTWQAVSSDHLLAPANTAQYSNVLIDSGQDLGTNTPTRRLLGAKIETFEFEIKMPDTLKLTIDGVGCDLGTNTAALTPSIPTSVDLAPIDWSHFVSGYFRVGLSGAATAPDDDITGLKVSMKRPIKDAGRRRASKQPTELHHGTREFGFEFEKEFSGANAKNQYIAFRAQQEFAQEWKATIGANYVIQSVMYGWPDDNMVGDVGGGLEMIKALIKCSAYKKATNNIVTFTVKDGTTGAYV